MTTHHLRIPGHRVTPAPPISTGCPFCSSQDYRRGKPCSGCGTVEPSANSELSADQLLQKKFKPKSKRKRPAPVYQPTVDGVTGQTPVDDQDELDQYRDELDRLSVEVGDEHQADDSLLPTFEDLDSVPWD